MKKTLLAVSALVVLLAAWAVLSPYLALDSLGSALRSGDPAALEDRIDFPRVREDLKGQFNAVMMKKMSTDLKDNPFGVLGLAMASKLVESTVDSWVTPASLASMARGGSPKATVDEEGTARDPFSDARVTREAIDRFSAWVPSKNGKEIRFVFRWSGFRWMLTSITVPLDEQES